MLAEHAAEMGVIGKAALDRDFGQRPGAGNQHMLGTVETGIHLPLVRRKPCRRLERVAEMRLRQPGQAGDFLQPNAAKAIGFDELDGAS